MSSTAAEDISPGDAKQVFLRIEEIMTRNVVTVSMDSKLSQAMEICAENRFRHLPVVDDENKLVGVITDRDLKYYVSPRLGTLSENNADRETLNRRIHIIMMRAVVLAKPDMSIPDAVRLMLAHRVGCLPVVDNVHRVIGMVTTNDFLRLLAKIAS